MKKKLATLFLAVFALLVGIFGLTACGNSDDGGESMDNRNFVTLSAWLIWEGHDPNDASAVEIEQKVEDEFNRISMETYSTKVVFTWFASESDYKAALEQKYQDFDPENVTPDVSDPGKDSSEQTTVNDDYPELRPGQLDLVLMLDKEMYYSYVQDENGEYNKKLVQLDTFLKGTYKNVYNELGSIIQHAKAPTVASSGKATVTYNYYAIPNLNNVGQYTYLKVNKRVATDFHYNEDDVDTLAEVMSLLNSVERSGNPAYADYALLKEAFPYYNSFFFTPYAEGNTGVWNPENQSGTNGLLSFFWTNGKGSLSYGDLKCSLEDQNYLSYLALMNWCEATDNFSEENYIASVEKGDYGARYDDEYYYIVLDTPRMTDEDLYGGMWAISAYTVNAARAMEILTALETKKELLNTLVYGVEGDHYSFNNADKTVQSIGSYYMNPRYAGNLCYVYADKNQNNAVPHGISVAEKESFMIQKTQWVRDLCVHIEYQPELIAASVRVAEGEEPILEMNVIQKASDDIFAILMADTPEASTLEAYVAEFKALAAATMETRLNMPVNPADPVSDTVAELIEAHKKAVSNSGAIFKDTLAGNIHYWVLYQLVPAG